MAGTNEPARLFGEPRTTLSKRRTCRIVAVLMALLPAACAGAPSSPYVGAAPWEATAPVARASYSSPVAPYSTQRPASPTPWQPQSEHDAVSPKSQ